MDELVRRLTIGSHPIVIERQSLSMAELKYKLLVLRFALVKFVDTRGGTEIGINIEEGCDFSEADFENSKGSIHIVGWCQINYQKVRCIGDVDLSRMEGFARLEVVDD